MKHAFQFQPEKHGNTEMGEDYTPLPRSVIALLTDG